MDPQMERVFVANGEMQAQQIRAFLEGSGIAAMVRGEALRHTHGLSVDGLGAVDILVAAENAEQARELLASAEAGLIRLGDDADTSSDV